MISGFPTNLKIIIISSFSRRLPTFLRSPRKKYSWLHVVKFEAIWCKVFFFMFQSRKIRSNNWEVGKLQIK